jgi:hypothetical protein
MSSFPIQPISEDGRWLIHFGLEFILYPRRFIASEFDHALEVYRKFSPDGSWKYFKVAESLLWDSVSNPVLRTHEKDRSFLSGIHERIAEGWRTELHLWNGERPDAWEFQCGRVARNGSFEVPAFYRVVLPVDTHPEVLLQIATELTGGIEAISGHGGYCFSYNPSYKIQAFNRIYPISRRFWCIEIDDLDITPRVVRDAIKGVNWLTVIGSQFLESERVDSICRKLEKQFQIQWNKPNHGLMIIVDDHPITGDRHRHNQGLSRYFELARSLEFLLIKDHPELSGCFSEGGNTMRWFRRFVST